MVSFLQGTMDVLIRSTGRDGRLTEYGTSFPVAGSNVVDRPKYADGRIWLNSNQYFGEVEPMSWEFGLAGISCSEVAEGP